MKTSRKSGGFSLVELIVVIGIIGILAATLLAVIGGTTETARATKCLANMRSLSAAVQARAMDRDFYPFAGSRQGIGIDSSGSRVGVFYTEMPGWISWLSNGEQFKNKPKSKQSVDICPFYGTGKEEDAIYALTNGAIWRATGENRDVYLCPEHVQYRRNKGKKVPYWSYVMNAKFGYDTTKGSGAAGTIKASGLYQYGKLARADRVLLFAELPTVKIEKGEVRDYPDGDEWQCDCTLNYHATVDGKTYGGSWDGEPESIGFNHKLGKHGRCAHVTFADGHAEKITYGDGGLSVEELTALLCEGKDVAFDGKQWRKVANQD